MKLFDKLMKFKQRTEVVSKIIRKSVERLS